LFTKILLACFIETGYKTLPTDSKLNIHKRRKKQDVEKDPAQFNACFGALSWLFFFKPCNGVSQLRVPGGRTGKVPMW